MFETVPEAHANYEQRYGNHGCRYTRERWQAERERLQNKPKWEDAPEWITHLAQDKDGRWVWYPQAPITICESWSHDRSTAPNGKPCMTASKGKVLGDWRDTLERRPTHIDSFENYTCQPDAHKSGENVDTSAPVNASGMKFDTDKPRFDLIPPSAERLLADVLTFGAKKYAPGNWAKVENGKERYIAAALRHINAHRTGEWNDEETGLPHLAHAMCCLAFVIELEAAQ
jgi:hypothetical protein